MNDRRARSIAPSLEYPSFSHMMSSSFKISGFTQGCILKFLVRLINVMVSPGCLLMGLNIYPSWLGVKDNLLFEQKKNRATPVRV